MTDDKDPRAEADQRAAADATSEGMPEGPDAAEADASAEPETEGDIEFAKVDSGVYGVWLTLGDSKRRVGSVARDGSGEWRAYSTTGHAGRESFDTRQAAAEALAQPRRSNPLGVVREG